MKISNETKKEIEKTWFWNWGLTYKTIAKLFKVSASTVSRVIRDSVYY